VKAQVRYTYGHNMSGTGQNEVLEYGRIWDSEGHVDEGPYVVMYTHEAWAAQAVAAILNEDGEGKQGIWPPKATVDHAIDATQSLSHRKSPIHDELFGSHVHDGVPHTHDPKPVGPWAAPECAGNGSCSC
jgi:hypothetical protein